jgi:hypothetical protein
MPLDSANFLSLRQTCKAAQPSAYFSQQNFTKKFTHRSKAVLAAFIPSGNSRNSKAITTTLGAKTLILPHEIQTVRDPIFGITDVEEQTGWIEFFSEAIEACSKQYGKGVPSYAIDLDSSPQMLDKPDSYV